MPFSRRPVIAIVSCLALVSCGESREAPPKPTAPAVGEAPPSRSSAPAASSGVRRIGDVGEIAVSIPDLKGLSAKEKQRLLKGHAAAAAADTIRLARLGPVGLRTWRILRGILEAGEAIPSEIREKIAPYAERFMLHRGPFDAWTGEKLRPTFIPGELAAAAQIAIQRGIDLGEQDYREADLGANELEHLEAFLNSVRPFIFRQGGEGGAAEDSDSDSDTASGADPSPPSSSVPELPLPKTEKLLDVQTAVSAYRQTGDRAPLERYAAQWLKSDDPVEILAGFVLGPRSPDPDLDRAAFGAFVAVRDDDRSPMVRKVAEEAPYYEYRLPGNAMFRRPRKTIPIPDAGAYNLVGAFGAMGPRTAPVFAYPYPAFASGTAGQRTLIFSNLLDAEAEVFGKQRIRAFSATEEIGFRREKWQATGRTAFLMLKHVIGFQAGARPKTAAPGTPHGAVLSRDAAVLAALHADLVALYLAFDPKTEAIGLVPEPECAQAIYDEYVSRFQEQAVPVLPAGILPDPAVVARRIIVRFMIEKGAVAVTAEAGRFSVAVVSHEAMRDAVGRLLADVQRMVSVNDLDGIKTLTEQYGAGPPKAWQADVSERLAALGLPEKLSFEVPSIVPERDANGELIDLRLLPRAPLVDRLKAQRGLP